MSILTTDFSTTTSLALSSEQYASPNEKCLDMSVAAEFDEVAPSPASVEAGVQLFDKTLVQ